MFTKYTVMFIGHRYIENPILVDEKIKGTLLEILKSEKTIEVLIGESGEFDKIAAANVKRLKKENDADITMVLVLPYIKKDMEYYEKYFDEVEICEESVSVYFKSAIQTRNRFMVNRSDLIVSYVEHNYGGAYKTLEYAIKKEKKIINLAD